MEGDLLRLPKLCGADIELGNFILGHRNTDTCHNAASLLLAEFDGRPRRAPAVPSREPARTYGKRRRHYEPSGFAGYSGGGWNSGWHNSQDWGRKFLMTNGGCVYIDLGHLELCIPEVISAWDHASAWHAMLRLTRDAMNAANKKRPHGESIQVLVNNSDGCSNSYGSHLNFLVTRKAWNDIIHRKPHYLAWLASFQVSSIIYTGQGKVGSENFSSPVDFQLSQRADYFERLQGIETTSHRPIVNTRDEELCGGESDLARLHVIFFDNTLAHLSCLLKVGVMQLMLAMIEAEHVNPLLALDDPLTALGIFSRDPTLSSRAMLVSGQEVTAVELQQMFLAEADQFEVGLGFAGFVPRAEEILDLWSDTLDLLQAADWDSLAPRLDWVMKKTILERAMAQRSLDWDSPETMHLDKVYASLGDDGLYWAYENAGFAERLLDEERIKHFCSQPPENTRAWARAVLLRTARAGSVSDVNWDSLSFRSEHGPLKVSMGNPLKMTEAELGPLFAANMDFSDLIDAITGDNRSHYETEKAAG